MSRNRDLADVLHLMFRGKSCTSYTYLDYDVPNNDFLYMEIPLNQRFFEVPVFAFPALLDAVKANTGGEIDVLAVKLIKGSKRSRYSTVDRAMKDLLIENYKNSKLVSVEAKQGETPIKYYCTAGAVFDKDFHPLAVCSYQMEKFMAETINSGEQDRIITKYKFLRPILRVHPSVFLYKATSMERFIVNKIVNICLENKVNMPGSWDLDEHFEIGEFHDTEEYQVKVEIDDCQFLIHPVDTPSISTTNKQLLQLAINHIDELIQ